MKVYIPQYPEISAGGMIYRGYYNAWQSLGCEVVYYKSINEINDSDYIIMCVDNDMVINNNKFIEILNECKKMICFCNGSWAPTIFKTYCTQLTKEQIEIICKSDKFIAWSFTSNRYDKWGHDYYDKFNFNFLGLPLAYDNFTYKHIVDKEWEYDVCFVGAYVQNGNIPFKAQHIIEWIMSLESKGLKCGFFGMGDRKKITLEDEAKLLYNSKIALNVNDLYQILMGSDINERAFKSLGSNGFLITDYVKQSDILNLPCINCNNVNEFHQQIFQHLNADLSTVKEYNRKFMLDNHTYVNRVKDILNRI